MSSVNLNVAGPSVPVGCLADLIDESGYTIASGRLGGQGNFGSLHDGSGMVGDGTLNAPLN